MTKHNKMTALELARYEERRYLRYRERGLSPREALKAVRADVLRYFQRIEKHVPPDQVQKTMF